MVNIRGIWLHPYCPFYAITTPVFPNDMESTRREVDEYPRSADKVVWNIDNGVPFLILNEQRNLSEKCVGVLYQNQFD
jgi:hypothetical protein